MTCKQSKHVCYKKILLFLKLNGLICLEYGDSDRSWYTHQIGIPLRQPVTSGSQLNVFEHQSWSILPTGM